MKALLRLSALIDSLTEAIGRLLTYIVLVMVLITGVKLLLD